MNKKQLFIFDMDGVLLDSEPFWRKAQIDILSQFGVSICIDDCIQNTMGKRIDDISAIWVNMFQLPVSIHSFSEQLLQKTASLIRENAVARTGIYPLIDFLTQNGYRLALATSSSVPIICAVLERLKIEDVFELTLSADDVDKGKPAPDVYLEVCKRLDVSTENAVALEDSLTGVSSAVAASITTIAIPEFASIDFDIADFMVNDIDEVIDLLVTDL